MLPTLADNFQKCPKLQKSFILKMKTSNSFAALLFSSLARRRSASLRAGPGRLEAVPGAQVAADLAPITKMC